MMMNNNPVYHIVNPISTMDLYKIFHMKQYLELIIELLTIQLIKCIK